MSFAGWFIYKSYDEQNKLKKQEELEKGLRDAKMEAANCDSMGTECRICMEKPINVVYIPCHHFCVCFECYLKIREDADRQR